MFRQLARAVQGRAGRSLHSSCRHLGGGKSVLSRHNPAASLLVNSSFHNNEVPGKSFAFSGLEGRNFATRATKDLVRILNAELAHEEKTYETPDEVEVGPPSEWTIELTPGAAEICLRRSFEGEDIRVMVAQHDPLEEEEHVEGEGGDDEEETPLPAMPISATISISKDGDKPPLEFITRIEDNFEIESVRYDSFVGTEDHVPYEPVFSDLDESLVNGFYRYLEERGIDGQLAKFVQVCITDKEQKEYQLWMSNISKFLDS